MRRVLRSLRDIPPRPPSGYIIDIQQDDSQAGEEGPIRATTTISNEEASSRTMGLPPSLVRGVGGNPEARRHVPPRAAGQGPPPISFGFGPFSFGQSLRSGRSRAETQQRQEGGEDQGGGEQATAEGGVKSSTTETMTTLQDSSKAEEGAEKMATETTTASAQDSTKAAEGAAPKEAAETTPTSSSEGTGGTASKEPEKVGFI